MTKAITTLEKMNIPIIRNEIAWTKLKAREFKWLATHRCQKHNKRYVVHPGCYIKEYPEKAAERIGFLDIEATNLHSAEFGYILSYCILSDSEDERLYSYCLKQEEIASFQFDKNLIKQFIKDIANFDRLIVYWGSDRRFDIPFLRSRALAWNLDFPGYRELFLQDLYDIVKSKLRLHRNRLETVAVFLGVKKKYIKKHRLDGKRWCRAQAGDAKSLEWIYLHNKEDVYCLREVYKKLMAFSANQNKSI